MRRCIPVLLLVVGMFGGTQLSGGSQFGGLLSIYMEPEAIAPGQITRIDVVASGSGSYAQLDIDVPTPLGVVSEITCVHSDWYCDSVSVGHAGSSNTRVSATGKPFVGLSFAMTVSFDIQVPPDVAPGMQFLVGSQVSGLVDVFGSPSSGPVQEQVTLTVLNPDGTLAEFIPTPTPTDLVGAQASVGSSPLTFMWSDSEARAGDRVMLDLFVPRSATWELDRWDSYAFLAWAEQSSIENLRTVNIDLTGELACLEGSEADLKPARDRAVSFTDEGRFPDSLTLLVGDDVRVGQRLLVCAELIGFAGDEELFNWNAYTTIVIVA